ncbi:MAG TPA: hypothetical protein VNL74_03455 [Methylococcus sp.]|nr:hypothetical protein [Methylococcus sp.]
MTRIEDITAILKRLPPEALSQVLEFAGELLSRYEETPPDEQTAWEAAVSLRSAADPGKAGSGE